MSKEPLNLTKPEHWAEWFEKCTVVLCEADTRRAFGNFAKERYSRYISIALSEQGRATSRLPVEARDLVDPEIPGVECWRDLELSYWLRDKKSAKDDLSLSQAGGKTFKKDLMERASRIACPQEARNFLESKTTQNLIRSRCRTIITSSMRQVDSKNDESENSWDENYLQGNLKTDKKGKELLHPDYDPPEPVLPSVDAQLTEEAKRIFTGLTDEEKVLILACLNEISLEHPEIKNRLGRGKSVLFTRQAVARGKIATMLGVVGSIQKYQGDPLYLGRILSRLLEILKKWADSPECGIGSCLMGDGVKP